MESSVQIACQLNTLDADEQRRRKKLFDEVRAAVEETRDLPDGYAWRVPDEIALDGRTTELISLERRCCPFFRFSLVFEESDGPVWLTITGPPGVKEFIRDEMA